MSPRSPLGRLVPRSATPAHVIARLKREALDHNVAVIDLTKVALDELDKAAWAREEARRQLRDLTARALP